MAAVGVDNDASVVPECANGKLPVRLSTLASKAHVDSTWCGLRPAPATLTPTLRNPPRRATQWSAAQPLTSIEVSGAADLRLLVRLVNAAGESQRPTPDRPPHLDRTAEPLPTQLHRGRHRVERPSVVGIQPLPPFLWRTPRCPREGRLAVLAALKAETRSRHHGRSAPERRWSFVLSAWSRRGLALPWPRRTLGVIRIERFGPHRLANREGLCRIVSAESFTIFAEALRYSRASSRYRSASRFALSRRVFQPRLAAALRFFRTRSMSCTSFSAVRWARRRAFSTLRSSRSITAGERTGQT